MKKLLALAMTAIMAVAAQAVTVTWEKGSDDTSHEVVLTNSFTVAVVVTLNSANTSNGDWSLITLGSSGALYSYKNSGGLGMGINGNEGYWTANGKTAATGQQVVFLNFVRDDTNTTSAVTFYVGDTAITDYWQGKNADGNNISGESLTLTFNTSDNWTIDEVAVYDTVLTSAEMAKVTATKDPASVPEPTAMALIALGVAGLALKRKVA